MQKIFYITKNIEQNGGCAPSTDRFQRIEKLNMLVGSGWEIKGFRSCAGEEYFILEKPDCEEV